VTFCHLTLQNILRQFLMQTSPSLQNVVHMTVPVRIIQDNTTKSQRSMIGFKISLLQAARKEKREKRGEEQEPKKVQEARIVGMPLQSVASRKGCATRISAYISIRIENYCKSWRLPPCASHLFPFFLWTYGHAILMTK
jgi:hypothetical protein